MWTFIRTVSPCTYVLYLLILIVNGEVCKQFDEFQRIIYKTCKTGCCGTIHNSYCCIHKHLGVIVICSVFGVLVLFAVVATIIYWCKQRQQRPRIEYKSVTRKYGTFPKADDTDNPEISSAPNTSRKTPVVVVVPEVEITVTPATAAPQEASFFTDTKQKLDHQ